MTALDDLKMDSDDAQVGVAIVRKALEVPLRKIAENAGKDGSVILQEVRREQNRRRISTLDIMSSARIRRHGQRWGD